MAEFPKKCVFFAINPKLTAIFVKNIKKSCKIRISKLSAKVRGHRFNNKKGAKK
ncbi:MAG: hypothetical protein HAW59_05615 [Betaproteobacteria bacterium]|nr:hypothetical protein [Betaproteobacteria bacterium]